MKTVKGFWQSVAAAGVMAMTASAQADEIRRHILPMKASPETTS